MRVLFLIVSIILIITLACASAWKTAEIRMIHKIRQSFENRKLLLKGIEDKYSEDFFRGFDEAEKMLNDMEEEVKKEKLI